MRFILAIAAVLMMCENDSPVVYVCDSQSATKYHLTKECRGLGSCKHEIKKVSVESAKKSGYTHCGWED